MTVVTAEPADTAELRARLDAQLAAFLDRRAAQWPAEVPAGLPEALRRFVLAGGKRIRPMFCYWGWRAAGGGDEEPIMAAAAALELFHTFALIHDDIMDGSERRRGWPSAHRFFADLHQDAAWRGDPATFGRDVALLCGDLCAAWSDQMFHECGLDAGRVARGHRLFVTMRVEAIAGQYLDLTGTVAGSSLLDALTVVRMKAGRYTVTRPLQIGAVLAGGGPELVAALAGFGDPLGDAFQLRDDLLGVFGEPTVTGKSVLDDLREGKPTALIALTRRDAAPADAARLAALFGDPRLDAHGAAELRRIIERSGARDHLEEMIRVRATEALAALAAAPVPPPVADALAELVDRVVDRRH